LLRTSQEKKENNVIYTLATNPTIGDENIKKLLQLSDFGVFIWLCTNESLNKEAMNRILSISKERTENFKEELRKFREERDYRHLSKLLV
ncbi:MAG: hypothetical protein ACP5FX_03305, partial [Candidatus Micrarchaeia archaeon]